MNATMTKALPFDTQFQRQSMAPNHLLSLCKVLEPIWCSVRAFPLRL